MMIRPLTTRIAAAAAIALPTVAAVGAPPPVLPVDRYTVPVDAYDAAGGHASTHVIVRLREGVSPAQLDDGRATLRLAARAGAAPDVHPAEAAIADLIDRWGATAVEPLWNPPPRNAALAAQLGMDRDHVLRVPEGSDTRALAAELGAFPAHIEIAEPDAIGGILDLPPNDPSFNQQYGLHNTGQTVGPQAGTPGADIRALDAWQIHTGTDDITIAVIDTGVSNSHPDLAPKLVQGRNFTSSDPNATGDSWLIPHGTHCAGIAAAESNNGIGITGVSWGARIMPIRVLNVFGGGTESNIAAGVVWAADNGAHVGSMSLGTPDGIAAFRSAIEYADQTGMLVFAASGNTPGATIPFPARWPETVTVGATDNRDNLASFTTTGPQMSVTAPGVDVYSTWDGLFSPNSYTLQSGTSMATPHAAGLAALVWSYNPSLTAHEVRAIIEQTADDKGSPGWNPQFGHGRINAHAALLAAAPCPADFAEPFGTLDVFDVIAFLALFEAQDPRADLAEPFGAFDVFDVLEFLALFEAGCP